MLSPDFRGCVPVADLSSLDLPPGVGVVVDVRCGDLVPTTTAVVDLREGVEGRLIGLSVARLSSSASRSCSDLDDAAICFDFELVILVGFGARVSVPRSSNWARSSSSVGAAFDFLEAIVSLMCESTLLNSVSLYCETASVVRTVAQGPSQECGTTCSRMCVVAIFLSPIIG